jgi:hypothetical protein
MKFEEIKREISDLRNQIQELQSTCYVVHPAVDPKYNFIAYLDLETLQMNYAVVDQNMNSIEILNQLPVMIMIEFGEFMRNIETWQVTPEMDFPYAQYVGDFSEFTHLNDPVTFSPSDHKFDGEEGKLV